MFLPTRRELMKFGTCLFGAGALPFACRARDFNSTGNLPFVGVNLAGAEFGNIPGRHSIDYFYPSPKDVSYYADLGFTCLRLPFRWERLQPDLFGDFPSDEQERIAGIVEFIGSRGLFSVVDPHNFAKRRVKSDNWLIEHSIGSGSVPTDSFVDFWQRLAGIFKNSDQIIFGLMNEPSDITANAWLEITNRTIAAIRQTGAKNLILVPGVAHTGAHSWMHSGNTIMADVIDPINHFAIEVHQYFDANSSGQSAEAVSGSCGSDRLREFQDWARQNRLKAFLGEFGAAANPTSLAALADICQEMSANSDVWLGWSAWAAGTYWLPDYIFNLEPPAEGGIRKQTQMLAEYARPGSPDYWVRKGALIDLDLERNRSFGCRDPSEALIFDQRKSAHGGQPGNIGVRGPLLRLMRMPEFTLMIETRDLGKTLADCDLLRVTAGPLLQRTNDGALRSPLADSLRTSTQSMEKWNKKRRSAISIKVAGQHVSIATTGGGSVSRLASLPEVDNVVVSCAADGGCTTRVTGFAQYMEGPTLQELVL